MRPVKYDWIVAKESYCLYMQWALDIGRHFLDVWDNYDS
jgi:hypothetical protein